VLFRGGHSKHGRLRRPRPPVSHLCWNWAGNFQSQYLGGLLGKRKIFTAFFQRMFSAFKKLTSKTDSPGQNGSGSPQAAGVQSMSHNLQKKFSKVRYCLLLLKVL
jgi:hypothetical protein